MNKYFSNFNKKLKKKIEKLINIISKKKTSNLIKYQKN